MNEEEPKVEACEYATCKYYGDFNSSCVDVNFMNKYCFGVCLQFFYERFWKCMVESKREIRGQIDKLKEESNDGRKEDKS